MPTDPKKVIRKLRAILSADVKGYSLLMSDDEAFTIKTLKEYRGIMSFHIQQHTGRVVDAPGDNMLAEFASAVDAVQCAVDIQKALKMKNENLPEDKKLQFRIGVNIGDIVQDGDSIYGGGVNVAARIEGLADPGGICISRNAYDHIRDKLDLGYEYLGDHNVKNIKHPVRVYKVLMGSEDAGKLIGDVPKPVTKKWVWATALLAIIVITSVVWQVYQKMAEPEFEPANVEKMAYPLPEKPSIAVLPFDNMSDDPAQEFFSDGITEDIITVLSKTDQLFVIARNSTFSYKDKPTSVKQIAEELGVRYVLEGSVRKSEDRVRITAQLIDAVKGTHLWAERYDRDLKDLFALQDEITLKIVTALEIKLTDGEQARLLGEKIENIDIKMKQMELSSLWVKGTNESYIRVPQLSQELIDMAPESPHGYMMLAAHHWQLAYLGRSTSPKESIKKAFGLAQKVISLDDTDSWSHSMLGTIYLQMRQYDKAIAEGKRAIALDPNGAFAHYNLGYILSYVDRVDEGIDQLKQAIRLNPFPPYYYYMMLSRCYRIKGQYEKALSEIKKSTQLAPNWWGNYFLMAVIYAQMDRQEEAAAAAKKVLELNPNLSIERYSKAWPYKNPAKVKILINAALKAGLPYTPPLPLPDKPSIAVLAFDNLSGDPEQEYFSDGLSEEIISALSKTDQLFVIARNSSFTYKGKPVNVKQISRELGVRYVLEGSVRKSEDRVRITAQLIDATTGHHLWSERYDRDLKDIFALQDEITMQIVTSLQVKLTEGEQARMWSKKAKNLDLYLKMMEVMSLWREGTIESHMRHGQIGQEIIDMAPESGIGHRVLAWHYWYLAMNGKSPQESIAKAFKLAQKAISLDESDSMAHALLGSVYLIMKKHEKAIAAGERSVELDPNGAEVKGILGITLGYAGKLDEAIGYLNRGIRLNPFPAYWYFLHLGRCYRQKGQYDEALTAYKKALHLSPDAYINHISLAAIYVLLDQQEEAEAAAKKVLEINPKFSVERASKGWPYKNQADLKLVVDSLRKAGLPE